MILNLQSIS